jgi:hypothetical protein
MSRGGISKTAVKNAKKRAAALQVKPIRVIEWRCGNWCKGWGKCVSPTTCSLRGCVKVAPKGEQYGEVGKVTDE